MPEPVKNAPTIPALTFEQLLELLKTATASGNSPELEAIRAMAQAQMEATKQLGSEVKRTVIRSNAEHENVSVFNYKAGCPYCEKKERHPEGDLGGGKLGHPKPALKYASYFPKQARVVVDDATVLEIELFNAIGDRLSENPLQPITARAGQWKAWCSPDGRNVFVDAPTFTSDERNSLPSLPQLLLELLHGKQAVNPDSAVIENIELRRRLEELERKAAVPA